MYKMTIKNIYMKKNQLTQKLPQTIQKTINLKKRKIYKKIDVNLCKHGMFESRNMKRRAS